MNSPAKKGVKVPGRRCVIAMFLFCWISGAAAQIRETGDMSGRWEADGVPGSPWTFDLAMAGGVVTGKVLQHGGQPGPAAVYDGTAKGNAIAFKCKSPDGDRIISFTGTVTGAAIRFSRTVEVLSGSVKDTSVTGVQADTGVFGMNPIREFAVKRVGPVPTPKQAFSSESAGRPNPTGRWEQVQWNLDVWILELQTDGNKLLGSLSQTPGPNRQFDTGPSPILDGTIDGNRIAFKIKSNDGLRTIAFTGKIYGNEIALTRQVSVRPGEDPRRANIINTTILGAHSPLEFVARRVREGTAVVASASDDIDALLQAFRKQQDALRNGGTGENVEAMLTRFRSRQDAGQNPLQKEILQAEAKWKARPFKNYEFTLAWECFCPAPGHMPMTFRTIGGVGVLASALPGQEAKKPVVERYATIEQLFTLLTAAAARDPFQLKVEYHPDLGYPLAAEIDPSGITADDDMRFTVTNFRILD